MTKDEFVTKHLDEMVGLLLAAYSTVEASHKYADDSFAKDGKFFIAQMKRARAFLGRMYDDVVRKEGAK